MRDQLPVKSSNRFQSTPVTFIGDRIAQSFCEVSESYYVSDSQSSCPTGILRPTCAVPLCSATVLQPLLERVHAPWCPYNLCRPGPISLFFELRPMQSPRFSDLFQIQFPASYVSQSNFRLLLRILPTMVSGQNMQDQSPIPAFSKHAHRVPHVLSTLIRLVYSYCSNE